MCFWLLTLWFLFLFSMPDGFMRNFQTQLTTWATDLPVTRRTIQNRIPHQSTLPFHFFPSSPTTLHKRCLLWAAAAPAPHQKTLSLLLHTLQPSLNTPLYRVCHLLRLEWGHILFPKNSMCEAASSHRPKLLEPEHISLEKVWKTLFEARWTIRAAALYYRSLRTLNILLLDFYSVFT